MVRKYRSRSQGAKVFEKQAKPDFQKLAGGPLPYQFTFCRKRTGISISPRRRDNARDGDKPRVLGY
jgi:hypothetical protein